MRETITEPFKFDNCVFLGKQKQFFHETYFFRCPCCGDDYPDKENNWREGYCVQCFESGKHKEQIKSIVIE